MGRFCRLFITLTNHVWNSLSVIAPKSCALLTSSASFASQVRVSAVMVTTSRPMKRTSTSTLRTPCSPSIVVAVVTTTPKPCSTPSTVSLISTSTTLLSVPTPLPLTLISTGSSPS